MWRTPADAPQGHCAISTCSLHSSRSVLVLTVIQRRRHHACMPHLLLTKYKLLTLQHYAVSRFPVRTVGMPSLAANLLCGKRRQTCRYVTAISRSFLSTHFVAEQHTFSDGGGKQNCLCVDISAR